MTALSKISVLIMTLNEAENLPRCLSALKDFDDVIVVDSGSEDDTISIADKFGARVENFNWNGEYPKKRQWCLDNLDIKNDFVFFVDGDEEVTPELVQEMQSLDLTAAGYFVKGRYIWNGRLLKHGLVNNKLALFNRHKMEFPAIDDLDIDGMGEMEGHYQPVLKLEYEHEPIGWLSQPLYHYAYEDKAKWRDRHLRYATWEAGMITRNAYPADPIPLREAVKNIFRKLPLRGLFAFLHSYILKLGFLDGKAGYDFALSRLLYYKAVSDVLATNKALEKSCVTDKAEFVSQK